MEFTTPKFHWMLHFGDHLLKLAMLISCWSLERKHKIPKRYGTDIRNMSTYDSSLIHEVSCDHLSKLNDPSTFDFTRVGLLRPRPATQRLVDFVKSALHLPGNIGDLQVKMSTRCRISAYTVCSVADVILVSKPTAGGANEIVAGELWACLEVAGETVLIVTQWTMVAKIHGAATWRVAMVPELVPCSCVLDCLVWAKLTPTTVKTLLPVAYC